MNGIIEVLPQVISVAKTGIVMHELAGLIISIVVGIAILVVTISLSIWLLRGD